MSAEQASSSFAEPSTHPPTPKQTPTFAILPSPVFETPKNNQGRFDESSGCTPRFAEEYSVFNATPGNLRGSQHPFPDFGPTTPYSAGANHKRAFSTEGSAAGIAAHVTEFSPNPSLPLPPVEPSKVLRSSPIPSRTPTLDRSVSAGQPPISVEISAKKSRRASAAQDPQGQTATPPPSARKGERKLAPKLDTKAMQNDQGFDHQSHFMVTAQQQGMGNFVTAQGDMFGYPLSAPATAPAAFEGQRSFWDPDPGLAGMDIDFGANDGNVFQPPTSQQPSGSVDWARANQMLQTQGDVAGHLDGHASVGNGQSALVSQAPVPMLVSSPTEHPMFAASYSNPVEDPFGISDGGAVNPGLIFSRPQTANMDAAQLSQPAQVPSSSAPATTPNNQATSGGPSVSKASGRGELRRSASAKDATPRKHDRTLASSPVKATGRPNLSRSFSENRGKKAMTRPALPTLAPAPRPQSQLVNNAGVNANRPIVTQGPRPNGRSSPVKSAHRHHHHRLPSLNSIPETSGPRTRTEAKFTIDANGRARVETTVVVIDDPPSSISKRHSSYVARHQQWDSSDEDDDSSSTDDEPIIIPSRNTSFALPDPRKPTTIHPFHNSQRSMSERSTTSYTSFQGPSQEGPDSDGETVVNDLTPTRKNSGDAASELRKLRESRQRQRSSSAKSKRFSYSSHYPSHHHPATSPTTLSDTSLPTPTRTTDLRRRGIRCVCDRAEAARNEFLVQCESCELYVHGQCVSITQRTMPSIYICAFCSNTPNVRGGRIRDNGRISSEEGSASSPLAHKTFKSFR
ncbi:hypothetical protein VTK26DRAFT_2990 [Humicola hyalothermophila]